ncbi:MAG TPA: hypothetical protein VIS74_05745 [Chthoniobacterales bacterium]
MSLLACAMRMPERVGKYVRLYFNSGRRAIYEEWQFLEWSDGRLIPKASWHDESPYNNIDPSFAEAEVVGANEKPSVIRITDADSNSEFENAYVISKDGKLCAKLVITWKESLYTHHIGSAYDIERGWLFEKTTGLPRAIYPEGDANLPPLEELATVNVMGDADAVQRFSARPAN